MDVSELGYTQLARFSGRGPLFRLKCRGGRVTLEPDAGLEDGEPADLTGLAAHAGMVAHVTFL